MKIKRLGMYFKIDSKMLHLDDTLAQCTYVYF